jgi:DNA (cytosine-5)-methyltransferase 1
VDKLTAVDLFAGAGGATTGLQQAGITVVAAIENDAQAAASYRANHPAVTLIEADIRTVDPLILRKQLGLRQGSLDLLKACPPCQGFSSLAKGEIDEGRNDLVLDIARFVAEFRPRAILLENVPGLRRDRRLADLLELLRKDGYKFCQQVIDATSLGVPQRRKRLIVLGLSRTVRKAVPQSLDVITAQEVRTKLQTVREVFDELRSNLDPGDPMNIHRKSSRQVQARIKAVPINGSRFDLPKRHQLPCHMKLSKRNATASYGRLRLDEPAPTMTTRCTTPACGSFIHPTENRGITLREAAALQTFPYDYRFVGSYQSIERQIGNAVPVRMAEVLGRVVRRLVDRRSRMV